MGDETKILNYGDGIGKLEEIEYCFQETLTFPDHSGNKIFIDVETNGLPERFGFGYEGNYDKVRIVQMGWIITNKDNDILLSKCHIIKLEPGVPMKKTDIHGITMEQNQKDGVPFVEVYNELLKDINNNNVKLILSYGIDFDWNSLSNECSKHMINIFDNCSKICIMEMAKNYLGVQHGIKLEQLNNLLYNEDIKQKHNALDDSKMALKCYKYIVDNKKEKCYVKLLEITNSHHGYTIKKLKSICDEKKIKFNKTDGTEALMNYLLTNMDPSNEKLKLLDIDITKLELGLMSSKSGYSKYQLQKYCKKYDVMFKNSDSCMPLNRKLLKKIQPNNENLKLPDIEPNKLYVTCTKEGYNKDEIVEFCNKLKIRPKDKDNKKDLRKKLLLQLKLETELREFCEKYLPGDNTKDKYEILINKSYEVKIYLNIPSIDRKEAFELGAKRDKNTGKYYAPNGEDDLIERWGNKNVISESSSYESDNYSVINERNVSDTSNGTGNDISSSNILGMTGNNYVITKTMLSNDQQRDAKKSRDESNNRYLNNGVMLNNHGNEIKLSSDNQQCDEELIDENNNRYLNNGVILNNHGNEVVISYKSDSQISSESNKTEDNTEKRIEKEKNNCILM